jgi:ParB/RepB/Spo0J family partition protein
MPLVEITKIEVTGRHRSDLGDTSALAESMREIGQLQPIVVSSNYRLIAGERRLTAARSLGWSEIEVKVAESLTETAALLRAERDENTCRKAFTPTEEHSLYEALLDVELKAHAATKPPSKSDSSGPTVSSRLRKSIAEIVSGSAGRYKSLEKIGDIKRIADERDVSERVKLAAKNALAEIDETGNVNGAYIRVQLALKADESRQKADPDSWSPDEQLIFSDLRGGRTVVVSMRENHSNIVRWAKAEGLLIEIDRRTEWGNPFELPYDGDRETVIRNYAEHYLPNKPSLMSRLFELRGKALACWCAPDRCHGDVLKEAADRCRQ